MTTKPLNEDDIIDISFAVVEKERAAFEKWCTDNSYAASSSKWFAWLARAKLTEQPDAIDDVCHKALHDAWHECKIIESKYTSTGDPYDDHLSQVATECADAIMELAQVKQEALGKI